METIEERFARATRHLSREKTWLAGVSGGRDSVVLLHLLQAERFQNIIVCHLDHNVRKRAGKIELAFVEDIAVLSSMRIIYDKIKDSEALENAGEGDLRRLRMEFFARSAAKVGAAGVFLGHHADDLAETFLWNLLRGSGSAGLGGIQSQTDLVTAAGGLRIHRPLLDIWRKEIDLYVEKHGLPFVEDRSNQLRKYTRNRLRHDVIPWLEDRLDRKIRLKLHQTAAILQEENAWMDSLIEVDDWLAPLSVSWLRERPVALQRRVILRWLQIQKISEVGFLEVESVRSLLEIGAGAARVNLAQDRQARRRAGKIFLTGQKDR